MSVLLRKIAIVSYLSRELDSFRIFLFDDACWFFFSKDCDRHLFRVNWVRVFVLVGSIHLAAVGLVLRSTPVICMPSVGSNS